MLRLGNDRFRTYISALIGALFCVLRSYSLAVSLSPLFAFLATRIATLTLTRFQCLLAKAHAVRPVKDKRCLYFQTTSPFITYKLNLKWWSCGELNPSLSLVTPNSLSSFHKAY